MVTKFLWVDDDHNRHFEEISKMPELIITQAMDPFQALKKLETENFDVVLVDILFRYAPWDLPADIDVVRKRIGMEPKPARKGIPLAIWLSETEKYSMDVAIFSKLPGIAKEHPQLSGIDVFSKPNGLEKTREFLLEMLKGRTSG